ncbi:hypothetical protein [Corynebacterium mayonis]|uniref:hypothetical protein n=1 Tax=Corynebacterium mayonis TaxID=3062461 RepID=UPI003140C85A
MRKSIVAATTALMVAAGTFVAPAHAAVQPSPQEVVQAYFNGSSFPDSLNPVDLFQREVKGWEKMFSGDIEMSAEGSAESSSTWLLIFAVTTLIGQIIQFASKYVKF